MKINIKVIIAYISLISSNAEHFAVYFPYVSYFLGIIYFDPLSNRYSKLSSAPNSDLHVAWPMDTFYPCPIYLLCNIQRRWPVPPSWESEIMVLSFFPFLMLFSQFLFQHFLFHLTIKCWGPWGLIPRSSPLFPMLFLSEWSHQISWSQILFTFVNSRYISLTHTSLLISKLIHKNSYLIFLFGYLTGLADFKNLKLNGFSRFFP